MTVKPEANPYGKIIAILRGVTPDEILSVCGSLIRAGIKQIEVPLNSPAPFESIAKAVSEFGAETLIGAGTVVAVEQVHQLVDIGGRLVVSPNTNPDVIAEAIRNGMTTYPGAMTPSEIFIAKEAGATGVKLFPARGLGLEFIGDVKSVLPSDFPLLAVGGVESGNIRNWLDAGADGVGVGTSVFRPGDTFEEVFTKAAALVAAITDG